MGVPKKRRPRSEKRKHRLGWKMAPVTVSECPHCHEPKLPHRVCLNCGYYGGEEVIVMAGEEEKKEK